MSSCSPPRSFRAYVPIIRLSNTLMRGKRRLPSGDWQIPNFTISCALICWSSRPSKTSILEISSMATTLVLLSQIRLDHALVVADLFGRPLGDLLPMVEHDD